MGNPRVFFDITLDGKKAGRIIMEVRKPHHLPAGGLRTWVSLSPQFPKYIFRRSTSPVFMCLVLKCTFWRPVRSDWHFLSRQEDQGDVVASGNLDNAAVILPNLLYFICLKVVFKNNFQHLFATNCEWFGALFALWHVGFWTIILH